MGVTSNKEYGQAELSSQQVLHLEMIEHVIERMSQNSFALKGWVMTLVVAICALAANGSEQKFAIVSVIPIIVFWFLDSFYLQRERRYRALYDSVLEGTVNRSFSMDIAGIKTKKSNYMRCLFSVAEWVFYVSMLVGIAAVYYWIFISSLGGAAVNG